MKILVVDDSVVMRRINKNVLIEYGIPESDISEAGDGRMALAMAKAQSFNLILLDWNMPQLNGLDFVKQLRKLPEYNQTPIVMITSEAARYMVVEAIQAGVTNYVVKPVKGRDLIDKIGKYLGGKGGST